MTATRNAGVIRLMGMGTAALALLAPGALAQGGGVAGQLPSRVMVRTNDSTARAERLIIVQMTPLIDSLVQRLNTLPLGSPEFLVVDSTVQAAIRALPRPKDFNGREERFTFEITAPRAALRTSPMDFVPQGTLGFTTFGVNRTWFNPVGMYIQYFEYPTVVAIESNSPASRAGVHAGDSLVAYNGLDVRAQAINMTQLLTPGREVTVKLRREGEARDFTITVDKAPANLMSERRAGVAQEMATTAAAMDDRFLVERNAVAAARAPYSPRAQMGATTITARGTMAATVAPSPMAQGGVLGAAMTNVDPGLAASLVGMKGKQGVLVTMVPEGSLASRTGLRAGDVILRVDASDVASVPQFSMRLAMAEQSGADKIRLTVLRAGKTEEIFYVPR
jgi:hypothetical protein